LQIQLGSHWTPPLLGVQACPQLPTPPHFPLQLDGFATQPPPQTLGTPPPPQVWPATEQVDGPQVTTVPTQLCDGAVPQFFPEHACPSSTHCDWLTVKLLVEVPPWTLIVPERDEEESAVTE
jgi:hypothetical protein